jgi:CheY-like chemotaxis protein
MGLGFPDMATPVPNFQRRILLVEDHEDTRRLMIRLLETFGFLVEACGDAKTALGVDPGSFDVALIDIGLPDMAGDLLLGALLKRSRVKAIALTGSVEPDETDRFREAGFLHCLAKPVDLQVLVGVLEAVTSGPGQVS